MASVRSGPAAQACLLVVAVWAAGAHPARTTARAVPAGAGDCPSGHYDIPAGTTKIQDQAFQGCTELTSVTIPDSVTEIGISAFQGCTELTSVTIPDLVTEIGDSAFESCTGLTNMTIPDSVTEIGAGAFESCYMLTSVTIGNSVTKIGDHAFSSCHQLASVNIIGNSLTSIGQEAFFKCWELANVTIPNSCKSFDGAFEPPGCESRPKCTRVTRELPSYCKSGHCDIPAGTRAIANKSFESCTGLTSVTIPESVTKIGAEAFFGCTGLASVTIGDSVTEIGGGAFSGCSGLASVNIIGNSLISIGEKAFSDCNILGSVTIPDSVTKIGVSAFQCDDCGLTNVTIGDSVTEIGDSAFSGTGLTSVTIPDSVTKIGDSAFSNCALLTSVSIGNSVTVIGQKAFYQCTLLFSVTIPDSVTEIGHWAFGDCNLYPEIEIRHVTIPESLTQLTCSLGSVVKCAFPNTTVCRQVVVRRPMPPSSPPTTTSPTSPRPAPGGHSDGRSVGAGLVVLLLAGGLAAILLAGVVYARLRRRRAKPADEEAQAGGPLLAETDIMKDIQDLLEKVSSEDYYVPFERIQMGAMIAAGGQGRVFKGYWAGQEVVLKELFDLLITANTESFEKEIQNMIKYQQHPNMFFGFSVRSTPAMEQPSFYMISEYCAGGTIHDAIQVPGLSLLQMVVWALQICETMDHLHSQDPPVVHLDLKPENVLLTSKDYSTATIKICDLGCCRVSKTNRQITRALVGTLDYMAPEVPEPRCWLVICEHQVLDGSAPLVDGTKVDVYAVGILLAQMLTKQEPWPADVGTAKLMKLILDSKVRVVSEAVAPAPLCALVASMVFKDPSCRPTFGAVVSSLGRVIAEYGQDPRMRSVE